MSQKKFNPTWTIPTQQWTDWGLNDNITISIDTGNTLNYIDNVDLGTVSIDDITVTVDGQPYETGVQLNFGIDKTPEDDIETAQLILRGICPKCRNDNSDHVWDCPDWSNTTDTITLNTSQNITFGMPGMPYDPTDPGMAYDKTIIVNTNDAATVQPILDWDQWDE